MGWSKIDVNEIKKGCKRNKGWEGLKFEEFDGFIESCNANNVIHRKRRSQKKKTTIQFPYKGNNDISDPENNLKKLIRNKIHFMPRHA